MHRVQRCISLDRLSKIEYFSAIVVVSRNNERKIHQFSPEVKPKSKSQPMRIGWFRLSTGLNWSVESYPRLAKRLET